MSRHQELLERMRSANPVPHPALTDPDELGAVFSLLTERRAAMKAAPEKHYEQLSRKLEPPRHPRRQVVLVFAAAAVVVLAVVGVGSLLLQGDDTPPAAPPASTAPVITPAPVTNPPSTLPPPTRVPDGQPPATEAPAPTAAPEPAPLPVGDLVWSRLPHDAQVFGDGSTSMSISDVAYGHGLWVAVGRASAILGSDNAFVDRGLVLVSSDGLTWDRITGHVDLDFGAAPWLDGGPTMNAVAATDAGFVIVGTRFGGIDGEFRDTEAAVWTSPDGLAWAASPHDAGIFGGASGGAQSDAAEMRDVVANGDFLVAVGNRANAAAVWTSTDGGLDWRLLPHLPEVFGERDVPGDQDDFDFEAMTALSLSPSGYLAVGFDVVSTSPIAERHAAVWRSPDGRDWQRVEGNGSFEGEGLTAMRDVVATNAGYVAVGFEAGADPATPGERAAVWHSVDGVLWQRITHDDPLFGAFDDHITIDAIVSTPGGYVAVGTAGEARSSRGVVWTSPDGLIWSRNEDAALTGGDGVGLRGLAAAGNAIIAVGWESHLGTWEYGGYAAIWIATAG